MGCYHDGMQRTTISLPEELILRLKVLAAQRRTSMAALIREAVEEKTSETRPKPRSFGSFHSGGARLSERASNDEYEPPPWR